jgi:hypothetical protein
MACGPKEYRAHAETCLRRARNVRNPILAQEFEKLAQSKAEEQNKVRLAVQRGTQKRHCRTSTVPRP